MIVKASKCSEDVLQNVANLVYNHENFRNENFPLCSTPMEVGEALAVSDAWFVLAASEILAVFRLEMDDRTARVSRMCIFDRGNIEAVVAGLRRDLHEMRIDSLTLKVKPAEAEPYIACGFARGHTFQRFSRAPAESNMMPILPLTNATQRDLPALSRLMYEAYAKTDRGVSNVQSAEAQLRRLMSSTTGQYLSDASFATGAASNLVSACLLTMDSPGEAKIEQLFTHPLYRARGLATTEIAASMNYLAASGVKSLIGWNREGDEVVRRLLTKMGFRQDRTVVEVKAGV